MKTTSDHGSRRYRLFWLLIALPWGALHAQDYSLPYTFTTLAGASSFGTNDGSGPAARFNAPGGIARGKDGVIYVVDSDNHTIRKVTAAGVVTTLAGSAGHTGTVDGQGEAARFNKPSRIAIDAQGNLYVTDLRNASVRKITSSGAVTTLARNLGPVSGVVVDSKGVITAANGFTFCRITPTGDVSRWTGDARGPDSFYEQEINLGYFGDLAIDASDNFYVMDIFLRTVWKITPAGLLSSVASGVTEYDPRLAGAGGFPVSSPHGLALDSAGNVYVTDSVGYVIRKLTPTVETIAGRLNAPGSDDGSGQAALFYYPSDLAADETGNLFVADSGNNTIRKITAAGAVSTFAGLSYFDSIGEADGTGQNARFYQPNGVAVGPDGAVYVADQGNDIIRKISVQGVVSTLAGRAGEAAYADGPGTTARFSDPTDLVVDGAGNVYVTDRGNSVVRKIGPDGVVSTLAGKAGEKGQVDGLGGAARFNELAGLGIDAGGNLYVAEGKSVRKITPSGEVSTVVNLSAAAYPRTILSDVAVDAGGVFYLCDPVAQRILKGNASGFTALSAAGKIAPYRIAVGSGGQIFVTNDSQSLPMARVARVTDNGTIELLAGNPDVNASAKGHLDGLGANVRFTQTAGIASDGLGNLYVADAQNNVIRKGQLAGAPVITTQPQSQTVATGSNVEFNVVFSLPALNVGRLTLQWYFNGQPISGEVFSRYVITSTQAVHAGDYTVVISNDVGSATSEKARLTVNSGAVTPPPATGGGGGKGGGGGAPSSWFFGALVALGVVRWLKLRGFIGSQGR